jgi:hypothetical protein
MLASMARSSPSVSSASGRIESVISVFNSTMKKVASVGLVAIAVLVAYCTLHRPPLLRETTRPLPSLAQDVLSEESIGDHFEPRLRAIIVTAEAANESARATLPKAQIVPDTSRNAMPRGFLMTTRQ